MSKVATIFTLSLLFLLLFCFGLIYASRPNVEFHAIFSLHDEGMKDVEGYKAGKTELDDESCEDEECLMRRTLAAHVDYIYTQKHKPRN